MAAGFELRLVEGGDRPRDGARRGVVGVGDEQSGDLFLDLRQWLLGGVQAEPDLPDGWFFRHDSLQSAGFDGYGVSCRAGTLPGHAAHGTEFLTPGQAACGSSL